VFRTNSSYARWDEARKIWGAVTNRSRDLVRQVRDMCGNMREVFWGPLGAETVPPGCMVENEAQQRDHTSHSSRPAAYAGAGSTVPSDNPCLHAAAQAESWMAVADDDLLDMVNRWMIALPRSMMVHLREDGDLEAELKVWGNAPNADHSKPRTC
jgi:Bestrophin, RFP-TM, chloride channel